MSKTKKKSKIKKSSVNILVIEDQPINQDIISEMLEELGYSCEIVDNGLDGIKKFHKKKYDLVFLDIMMPKIDGYQTVRKMRESEDSSRRVPIIAVSANIFVDNQGHIPVREIEECLNNGMDNFIAKPLRINVLEEMIKKYL